MYTYIVDCQKIKDIKDLYKFGARQTPLWGENCNNEQVELHIAPDNIIVKTYQNNGALRCNEYDRGGFMVSEWFEGRWNKKAV